MDPILTPNRLDRIDGNQISLRLIDVRDAEFVYETRSNAELSRHLSQVSGTVRHQRDWIKKYKQREAEKRELYYVIERRSDGVRCGLVRLYEIEDGKFTWGSFILTDEKPSKAALECAVLVHRIGFEWLHCTKSLLDVRNANEHAMRFYRRFGLVETHRDKLNTYFEYRAETFADRYDFFCKVLDFENSTPANMTGKNGHVELVDLPVISDPRGDLTFLEGDRHVPFPIRRVYFLYNVPVDSERGGHAHRELEQVVFALSGSFRIKTDDGTSKAEYWLRNPRQGLHIKKMVWREIDSFSQGAVCMVIASQYYDESDYFRNHDDFLKEVARLGQ